LELKCGKLKLDLSLTIFLVTDDEALADEARKTIAARRESEKKLEAEQKKAEEAKAEAEKADEKADEGEKEDL